MSWMYCTCNFLLRIRLTASHQSSKLRATYTPIGEKIDSGALIHARLSHFLRGESSTAPGTQATHPPRQPPGQPGSRETGCLCLGGIHVYVCRRQSVLLGHILRPSYVDTINNYAPSSLWSFRTSGWIISRFTGSSYLLKASQIQVKDVKMSSKTSTGYKSVPEIGPNFYLWCQNHAFFHRLGVNGKKFYQFEYENCIMVRNIFKTIPSGRRTENIFLV